MRPFTSISLVILLSGCTVGPDFVRPPVQPPVVKTLDSLSEAAHGNVVRISEQWWTSFGDSALTELIERSFEGNLGFRGALTRLDRSRAELRLAKAVGLPTVGGAVSYQRERASPNGILGLIGSAPGSSAASGSDPFGVVSLPGSSGSPPFDLFQAGVDASWEIDLWGKARRTREAARADAEATLRDIEALRISLGAEVARGYFRVRGAEAHLALLESSKAALGNSGRIAERRNQTGAASLIDVSVYRAELAKLDADIAEGEHNVAVARNALALLVGADPHGLDALLDSHKGEMPAALTLVPASLSSDLARQRPDIAAAEARLHAATARIGIAKADFYPSVGLFGSGGLQSLTLSDLPEWASHQFIVGPSIHLPIFQGGRLKGQLELTRTGEKAAAISFRETVLKAWHEVDDALSAVKSAKLRVASAQESVTQSQLAERLASRRYREGATGYLDVLIAERSRLANEAQLRVAQVDAGNAAVGLYKALGGGWTRQP